MSNNRIASHLGTGSTKSETTSETPPLVPLRHSVQGRCDFHIARVRKNVYEVRSGRAADAVVNFRHHPHLMEDTGHSKAWRRLRAVLVGADGREQQFELRDLECAEEAMYLAERVGDVINSWRLATGRSDFPTSSLVANALNLPESMVKAALRDYSQDAD